MTPSSHGETSELRATLRAAGAFDRQEGRHWRRFALLISCFFAVTALQLVSPWWGVVAIIPLQVLFLVPAVMHGHDGGHKALSESRRHNDTMLYLAFPLLAGLGVTWWRWKHNGPHHAHPNLVTKRRADPDIIFWPFATTQAHYEAAGPLQRWFQRRVQAWFFWPLTMLVHFRMRGKSFAHLFREIRKQGPSVATGLELLALVSHFTLWLVVPSLFFSFLPVLGVYLAVWGGVSLCLALIFIPAHVGMPVVTSYPDFVTLQMSSSRNYRPPRGLRWFCVGLQYQIEHHLFPTIPYIHLPLASEHARAWAAARGLPYRELTWLEGLRDSTRFLSQAWRTPAVQLGPERLAATPA